MAYRFQYRGDKESNWKDVILADREIGLLLNDQGKATNLYKIGDGKTKYQDLPYFGFNGSISSKLTAEEDERTDLTVLNKKVVIDEFAVIGSSINDLNQSLTDAQTDIASIKLTIGNDENTDTSIFAELNNIKLDIGERGDSDDIYTELDNIKFNIGADEKGNRESIYKEIDKIDLAIADRHQTKVINSSKWEEMNSGNGSEQVWENVLYFVYE